MPIKKEIDFGKINFIDLTHSLSSNIPHWSLDCGFKSTMVCDYDDCATDVKFKVQKLAMSSGIGTHIDAPSHCIAGGKSVEEIPFQQLFVSCVVIDVSASSHQNYCVSLKDIQAFENQYGMIAENTFVIFYTGWSQYWEQPDQYRNDLVFPSVSQAVSLLLLERKVVGIGIDTLSPDQPENGFPVHEMMLGAGKYIIENIANANQLPPTGSYTIAMPIKIEGGTEAPIRLVGMVYKKLGHK